VTPINGGGKNSCIHSLILLALFSISSRVALCLGGNGQKAKKRSEKKDKPHQLATIPTPYVLLDPIS